jgi:hypothetical protein
VLSWLGVAPATLDAVMPNLRNFAQKTVGYLHG